MKCKICGTINKKKSKVCSKCGAEISITQNENVNQRKSNVLNIILVVVIIALLIFGIYFFFFNEKSSDSLRNDMDNSNNYSEEDYTEERISLGNYNLYVPKGWIYNTYSDHKYIQNSECMIMFEEYTLHYDTLINNSQSLIDSLISQGYVIDSLNTRKIDGINFIVVIGSLNNIGYGFMFADLDSNTTIMLSIASNTLGEFNEEWLNYGSKFLASAKK
jgi:predicted nucleic acid-binding Zn ribbon protein